ncbi:MAG TPA: hypothetical protein VIH35_07745 [Kiritimatiellia bacterium]|jgi:hypothetical protein
MTEDGRRIAAAFLVATAVLAAAAEDKFPKNKWFNGVKGYNEALEIQKQTGADIFVYFARYYPKEEEGLCKWWEKRGVTAKPVDEFLEGFIKVKILYPLGKKDEEAVADFKVRKCPAVFIVSTNGFKQYCKVFQWPDGKPELIEPEQQVEVFRARSGPRYQVSETSEGSKSK